MGATSLPYSLSTYVKTWFFSVLFLVPIIGTGVGHKDWHTHDPFTPKLAGIPLIVESSDMSFINQTSSPDEIVSMRH
jgi:hypothetical protein